MTLNINPRITGLEPYQSFDEPYEVRLNTNENPYAIPSNVAEHIATAVYNAINAESERPINRYPSDNALELRNALLQYLTEIEPKISSFGLTAENIQVANGSNEIMQEIFSAFGGIDPGKTYPEQARNALTFAPSYSMYPQYARDSYTNLVKVPSLTTTDGKVDYQILNDQTAQVIKQYAPSIILLTNPNNPTGTWTSISDIKQILEFTQTLETKPLVVVDEAYAEFRNPVLKSAINLIDEYDNLLIVRTLSKAFGFAGARVGYTVGNKSIIDKLRVVHLPYNISSITQSAAVAVLKCRKQMLEKVVQIRQSRDEMLAELDMIAHNASKPFEIKVLPSQANFIQIGLFMQNVADMGELTAKLYSFLLAKSVQIRVVGEAGYFRVTVGTPAENERFLSGFREFLTQIRPEGEHNA